MKHTKKLYTKLYIVTLYSNLIVPLRRSSYIQLLYEDFSKKLTVFFQQTRQLVWQEYKNGLEQLFKSRMSLRCHQKIKVLKWGVEAKKYHQMTTEIPLEIRADEGRLKAKIEGKNINTTHHRLILLNSSFMLCY